VKRIICTAAVPVIACGLLWLGGYNFDTRNFFLAWYAGLTLFATGCVWLHPDWKA